MLGAGAAPATAQAAQDAVVMAVIDSGFSPYHQDFLADRMPAGSRPPALRAAHLAARLPGARRPSPRTGRSTSPSTAPTARRWPTCAPPTPSAWDGVESSSTEAVHYRWVPGTKVVGALAFGSDDVYGTGGLEHGMGSASSAVGNLHGTCPQCLLVFISYTDAASAEQALSWVHRQPWIDAVTNSYGFSASIAARDRVYNGTDVETEKKASERGQTTFFSAGNGLENAFTVPNSTLLSSQEGPDWVVTVGATDPLNGKDFTGTGKPADVAGIGHSYPTSYSSTTVDGVGDFSGTSNATPQVAGTYARALWEARRALAGPSRVQGGGVVAKGGRVACGPARPGCELGDGVLTAAELRTRLLHGATPTEGGFTDGAASLLETPPVADSRFASEGHGTFRGTLEADFATAELQRVVGPMLGRSGAPGRPDGEVEWFRVDSACRQSIWGSWGGGAYLDDERTPLPESDPVGWPTRTAIQEACPYLAPPPL